MYLGVGMPMHITNSVTIFGNLLDFRQLFKAFGSN